MLIDLGVLDPRADEFTAYTLMGKLVRNLSGLTAALPRDPECPAMIDRKIVREYETNYGGVHAVIGGMTRAQKELLRDRIIAACQPHKP